MTNAQQLKELREEIDMLKSVVIFLGARANLIPEEIEWVKRRLCIEE